MSQDLTESLKIKPLGPNLSGGLLTTVEVKAMMSNSARSK